MEQFTNLEYYVEYIDEFGMLNSEIWTEQVLNIELNDSSIKIVEVTLSVSDRIKFGLMEAE